ncbi:MAG: HU family DNA-binding protein [Candidatus Nanogingivalis sp.]
MPIYYKSVERINPLKPDEPKKFYASASTIKRTDLKELANSISKISTTVSHVDVYAVLMALTDEIKSRVVAGESIHLGDLGYFVTKLKSEGVEKADQVNASLIKDVKVRFTPGKDLEAEINAAEFKKAA